MKKQTKYLDEYLQECAEQIVWRVHNSDRNQKGPFKDDEEYRLYLFDIKRNLLAFFENTQKLMEVKRP